MDSEPHSNEYFIPARNFWWNDDFLALMATRWKLDQKQSVLDIGCGVGHWHRALLPFLSKTAKITGIDREPKWIEKVKTAKQSSGHQFEFVLGDALTLPFPDRSFDLVTCQTVLIHLRDPKAAIKEWMRVLKPQGLLAVAEPNNVANSLVFSSRDVSSHTEEILRKVKFQLTCERGKARLGLGHNSIGDLLPGYFNEVGLKNVEVYLSDKATKLIPPYETAGERAVLDQWKDWVKRDFGPWSEEETKKYYVAGGGTEESFEVARAEWLRNQQLDLEAASARTLHTSGGALTYLVSGIKA